MEDVLIHLVLLYIFSSHAREQRVDSLALGGCSQSKGYDGGKR